MRTCINCSILIVKKDNVYCNHKCRFEHRRATYIKNWIEGKESGRVGSTYQFSLYVRRFLLEEANYQCTMCGWGERNEVSDSIPLHIDHIDGDASNTTRMNLRVLCPNCHSLTPNYGSLNTGNSVRKY